MQLPGREQRFSEPLFTRLVPLVQTLAHILPPYVNLPFAFFGHSLGAPPLPIGGKFGGHPQAHLLGCEVVLSQKPAPHTRHRQRKLTPQPVSHLPEHLIVQTSDLPPCYTPSSVTRSR